MPQITKYRVKTVTRQMVDAETVMEFSGYIEFKSLPEAEDFAKGAEIETVTEESVTDEAFIPRQPSIED